ncbi:MAG: sigma-54 dependent transcriptional regulator [Armatimonadetes bacterium]|nr:sigma-54 dependent transcriptional regulator [Armatimonadota bacterium]
MATGRKPRAFIVEDDAGWRRAALAALADAGFSIREASCASEARNKAGEYNPNLLIVDHKLPDGDGVRLVKEFRARGLEAPAVITTETPSVGTAVQALGLAPSEYLVKPVPPGHLARRARQLLDPPPVVGCNFLWEALRAKYGFDHIFSENPLVQRCYAAAARVADCSVPVLIEGETGVGKEYLAKAIHYMNGRANHAFVALNCAAVPEALLESELFGHEKGAFTSASAQKRGLAEEAHLGTLFLDEVGEMSPVMQVKLLRFLEEGAFRRLGATSLTQVDVRIVAATNKNLLEEVEAGRFREDLYYRLAVIAFYLPPLRSRPEDIELFARTFVARHAGNEVELSSGALEKLMAHRWPGNLRELHNVIRRAVLLHRGKNITPDDICFDPIGRK